MPGESLVANTNEAERFVVARIADGADYIKVVADVPGLDQATLNVIVIAAHQHDKLVIAHVARTIATSMSQSVGADFITHGPINGVITDQEVDQMCKEKRISIPTLIIMKGTALRLEHDYNNKCINTVRVLHRSGVAILAGTDANKAQGVPANVRHGAGLYEELERLIEYGH